MTEQATSVPVVSRAEDLARRCELAAVRRAMRKLYATADKLRLADWRRAQECRDAAEMLGDRCTDIQLEMECYVVS